MRRSSRTHWTRPIVLMGSSVSIVALLSLIARTQEAEIEKTAEGQATKTVTKKTDAPKTKPDGKVPKGGSTAAEKASSEAAPLGDNLKAADEASKSVAAAVKTASDALEKAYQAEADALARASMPKADPKNVLDALGQARDAIKGVGQAQEKLSSALVGVAKSATKPTEPVPAPFPDAGFASACYRLDDTQVGFFAVRFAGSFDAEKIAAAGKQGRRLVELGQNLGKNGVLSRVAMKDGDTTYQNIAFGFYVKNEPAPTFIALGASEVCSLGIPGRPETDFARRARRHPFCFVFVFVFVPRGCPRKRPAHRHVRGDFAELLYELSGQPDLIQMVGSYVPMKVEAGAELLKAEPSKVEAKAGPFQFFAVVLKERVAFEQIQRKIEAAEEFGWTVAKARGVTLAPTRHGVRLLPGDRLLIVAASIEQDTRAGCLLTLDDLGEISVIGLAPTEGPRNDIPAAIPSPPYRLGDFVYLTFPRNLAIPVRMQTRPNYILDFTIQWDE